MDNEKYPELNERAIETLQERYLLQDDDGNVIEDLEEIFWRMADHVASAEGNHKYWANKFHHMVRSLDFLPNTPTIMNSGKPWPQGQLSACFVLPIRDNMYGIFYTLLNTAMIHKTGGGTGFDFSSLRSEGSQVGSKLGVSTGPLSFCQVYDEATDKIKAGSSRRGANMMVFNVHHPDILDFIDMKSGPGVMTNFNVSVAVTDEFLKAVDADEDYELRDPKSGATDKLNARMVWDKIAERAHAHAEPGVLFIDRINELSAFEERIVATNPCGEVPLPEYGSCNLGSINISNFIVDEDIDWNRLRETTRLATRFLDNVVDVNHFPLSWEFDDDGELVGYKEGPVEKKAKYYRNIGLGPMGWAEALVKLKIPYNSPEALKLGEEVMEFINKASNEYSVELGKEKGLPEGAPFKSFFDYQSDERRNSTCTVIAPTGTISVIAGCSSGIEPVFAWEMVRHQLDRQWHETNYLYEQAKEDGSYEKAVFVESHDIDVDYHVDMQAAFQAHCDQSISKTINLPKGSTVEDVKNAYSRGYEKGVKGMTVYVDGSREGVLRRKDSDDEIEPAHDLCPQCGKAQLIHESGCETCPNCSYSACSVA